jgi:hypothetical protein
MVQTVHRFAIEKRFSLSVFIVSAEECFDNIGAWSWLDRAKTLNLLPTYFFLLKTL